MSIGDIMSKSRSDYFKKYNKRSPVRSVRLPEDLLQKINDVVIQQGSSFNKAVIQQLRKSFENDPDQGGVVIQHGGVVIQHGGVVIQQLRDYLIFMMDFFQRNADVLRPRVSPEDRDIFRKIAQFLKEGEK